MFEIHSRFPWPSCDLSNFANHPFTIRGFSCAGMEGFLQGLKIQNTELQRKMFLIHGRDAHEMGKRFTWKNQTLWFQGTPINRHSEAYIGLVREAYYEMAVQNNSFRRALVATKGKALTHPIGCNDPTKTILTEKEFVDILEEMRNLL